MVSTVLATFQLLHALFSHQLVSTARRSFVLVQDISLPNSRAAPERLNTLGWLQRLSASGEPER